MNLSIIYRRFGEIYRSKSPVSPSGNLPIIYRWAKRICRSHGARRAIFSCPESTDNRPTFAQNRPIGCKGTAYGGIKKMAELSAMLYEQFACLCVARRQAEADQLDLPAEASAQAGAAIKRNLPAFRSRFGAGREVLGYGE